MGDERVSLLVCGASTCRKLSAIGGYAATVLDHVLRCYVSVGGDGTLGHAVGNVGCDVSKRLDYGALGELSGACRKSGNRKSLVELLGIKVDEIGGLGIVVVLGKVAGLNLLAGEPCSDDAA